MKPNTQAFTLIELLVVVLIIGILASVAIPQYQRAVQKAQFIKLRVLADSIGKTVWSYYLGNGDWPRSFDELDVSLPADMSTVTHPKSSSICASNSEMYCCILSPVKGSNVGAVACGKSDYAFSASYSFASHTGAPRDRHSCAERTTDSLCRTLPGAVRSGSGTSIMTPEGWKYRLSSYTID